MSASPHLPPEWWDAARRVATLNLPTDGPACVLYAGWGKVLRRCGWPVGQTVVDRPQTHSRGFGRGTQVGAAPQPAATAPEAWLVALAHELGVPLRSVAAGRLLDPGE